MQTGLYLTSDNVESISKNNKWDTILSIMLKSTILNEIKKQWISMHQITATTFIKKDPAIGHAKRNKH